MTGGELVDYSNDSLMAGRSFDSWLMANNASWWSMMVIDVCSLRLVVHVAWHVFNFGLIAPICHIRFVEILDGIPLAFFVPTHPEFFGISIFHSWHFMAHINLNPRKMVLPREGIADLAWPKITAHDWHPISSVQVTGYHAEVRAQPGATNSDLKRWAVPGSHPTVPSCLRHIPRLLVCPFLLGLHPGLPFRVSRLGGPISRAVGAADPPCWSL